MTSSNQRNEDLTKKAKASSVFTPGAPVNTLSLFKGRGKQIELALQAVNQIGCHPIIYGERGVGKTSLANVLHEIFYNARMAGLRFAHINCDAADTFDSLWQKVFKGLTISESGYVSEATTQKGLDLPMTLAEWIGKQMTPDQVLRTSSLIKAHLIVIIDEFDQLKEQIDVIQLMANTIKASSDQRVPLTIVLVGVADTIDELISQHESIDRNLVQIQMPRMSSEEVKEIVEGGLKALDFSIDEEALSFICYFAQGLPAAAHHIGLRLSYLLIDTKKTTATKIEVIQALISVIEGMGQSLLNDWNRAISSPRPNALWKQVLLACSLAPRNELGWFRPNDVADMFRLVTNNSSYGVGTYSQHLHILADNRGKVLERRGSAHRFEFRFKKPLFQSYILMKALTSKMITEKLLDSVKDNLPAQQ